MGCFFHSLEVPLPLEVGSAHQRCSGIQFTYPTRISKSSLFRRRVWVSSPKANTWVALFYPSRRLGIDARRLANPSLCSLHHRTTCDVYHQPFGLYLMLVLAHRLHGGTPCYVPSLTEHSQSNRRVVPSCKHGLTHA